MARMMVTHYGHDDGDNFAITIFTTMLLGVQAYDVREYAAPYAYTDC